MGGPDGPIREQRFASSRILLGIQNEFKTKFSLCFKKWLELLLLLVNDLSSDFAGSLKIELLVGMRWVSMHFLFERCYTHNKLTANA